MKFLLISGHGAGDPGATAAKYQEATETRKVTAALATKLKSVGSVTVYPTDRNAYSDYKAGKLKSTARFNQYDYVLEIHFNAFKKDAGDGKTKGVECYVTTTEKGISVEEAICKKVAAIGFTNRGVKRNNFAVIKTAKNAGVSAALLEVCFIDDADDMKVYEANRDKVATAIAEGIMEGFGLKDTLAAEKKTLKEKARLSDSTIEYLADYKYGDDLIKKLVAAMK